MYYVILFTIACCVLTGSINNYMVPNILVRNNGCAASLSEHGRQAWKWDLHRKKQQPRYLLLCLISMCTWRLYFTKAKENKYITRAGNPFLTPSLPSVHTLLNLFTFLWPLRMEENICPIVSSHFLYNVLYNFSSTTAYRFCCSLEIWMFMPVGVALVCTHSLCLSWQQKSKHLSHVTSSEYYLICTIVFMPYLSSSRMLLMFPDGSFSNFPLNTMGATFLLVLFSC